MRRRAAAGPGKKSPSNLMKVAAFCSKKSPPSAPANEPRLGREHGLLIWLEMGSNCLSNCPALLFPAAFQLAGSLTDHR